MIESSKLSITEIILKLKDILNTVKSKEILNEVEILRIETRVLDKSQIDIIVDLIGRNIDRAKSSHILAEQMLETVKKFSHLKVVEAAVPKGILPSGYSVALYDVRIAGHGPDETVYRRDKWIRQNVTRGMTFMKMTGKQKLCDFAIYANKKFTGGVGDEDERQPENNDVWREFCLQAPEEASQVICMTKLNGEAGHFTVRYIGDEFYIIAGSKNVHLLFKEYKDIEKYTESRYQVARTVATAVLNSFNTMGHSELICLKQFLNASKMTVVCEVLQPHYQHIINLSHLTEPTINMLMITSVPAKDGDSLTAIPPHLALGMGEAFGLAVPDYESISVGQVQERIEHMRRMKNSEGFVLYYLQGNETIGLAKVKTAWYIMLRALREKADNAFNAKKAKDTLLADRIKATKKRFVEIQKWIKFSDSYLKSWEALGEAYLKWLDVEIKKGKLVSKNIRPKFPIIWKTFLEDTKMTDDFTLS